jgi:hypothetical protein
MPIKQLKTKEIVVNQEAGVVNPNVKGRDENHLDKSLSEEWVTPKKEAHSGKTSSKI